DVAASGLLAPWNMLFPLPVGRVPVYRSAAVSSMEADRAVQAEFEAVAGRAWRRSQGLEIRTQSRRPINTPSRGLRRSALVMASEIASAVSATVKAKAATLASIR